MKWLTLIVAILLVACGNSKSSSRGKRTTPTDDLREVVKNITDRIHILKNDIDEVQTKTHQIVVELAESTDAFSTIWYQHESVNKIKTLIQDATAKGKNTTRCSKILESELRLVSSTAHQELNKAFEENKNQLEKYFENVNLQLDEIAVDLENNLETNLKQCQRDMANCKITEYKQETESDLGVINNIKDRLPNYTQLTLSLTRTVIPFLIEDALLPLITKCLEK